MGNNLLHRSRAAQRLPRRCCASAVTVVATVLLSLSGCSSKSANSPPAASITPANVSLTAAQRAKLQLYTVGPSKFRRTVEAVGTVDFDNDKATTVLEPFSGPSSRVLV